MRLLQLLLPLLASLSLALAQSPGASALLAAVDQLSPCSVSLHFNEKQNRVSDLQQRKCLLTAIEESTCGATNVTCICTNAQLQGNAEACLLTSCTLKEALSMRYYAKAKKKNSTDI